MRVESLTHSYLLDVLLSFGAIIFATVYCKGNRIMTMYPGSYP